MQQFNEVKADYPDHIVLFRMGDFYETFYEDARRASQILGITLTARDRERKVPMAGIPFHALDNYLGKLVDDNQKVVIVEQLEDPKEAKGVVKRGIVKIVTPGTNTLEKDIKRNNYLVSMAGKFEFAFVDIIQGTVNVVSFDNQKDFENNILLLAPKEIILPKSLAAHDFFSKNYLPKLSPVFNYIDEKTFALLDRDTSVTGDIAKEAESLDSSAVYGLLNYLAQTQKTDLAHITNINRITTSSTMRLDANAVRNLELIEGQRRGSVSLYELIDRCSTAAASKKLKSWMISPLLSKEAIDERLNSIQSFRSMGAKAIGDLQDILCQAHDLNRIASKVGLSSANARDLRNCVTTVKVIFKFVNELKTFEVSHHIEKLVGSIEDSIKSSQKVLAQIDKTIREDPPVTVREGGMVKSGIDEDLDKLHDLKTGGKDWLKDFEQNEIKRSGISTLKVRFNKVFGYYIEVSKGQSSKVPDDYIRKQTLVNAERYITPELKEQEANILGADDRIRKIEYDIFMGVLGETKEIIQYIQKISDCVASLDIFMALAKVSLEWSWTRPDIATDDVISIENGRHPVIEHFLQKDGKTFVKNSIYLSNDQSLHIITGPNMGGKSTFIRQAALIVILAQIGSYVPADSAHIGVVDSIFTRVGASDNLSQGESTFMVEMLEAAEILNHATKKSLVILDEIGRGTSTFDGMSIAWAICEYLQGLGTKTMFATHYHELTELSNKYPNVKNLAVKVIEYNGEIIFMHQITDGKADKSYGIHVAKLAGLPDRVIRSSERILKMLEKEKNKLQPKPQDLFADGAVDQDENNGAAKEKIIRELQDLNINTMSPLEAMQRLSEWKQLL